MAATSSWTTSEITQGLEKLDLNKKIWSYTFLPVFLPTLALLISRVTGKSWMEAWRGLWRTPIWYLISCIVTPSIGIVAHTGLRLSIPWTNLDIPLIAPILPNTCYKTTTHRRKTFPCMRDTTLSYLAKISSTGGWRHIADEEWRIAAWFVGKYAFMVAVTVVGLLLYFRIQRRNMARS